jgi:hypothetical protein
MRPWGSWASAVGLALLYTSQFYLHRIGGESAYWLPEVARQVLVPTCVGLAILIPVAAIWHVRYVRGSDRFRAITFLPISVLVLIALLKAFDAFGYSAVGVATLAAGGTIFNAKHGIHTIVGVVGLCAVAVILFAFRRRVSRLSEFLSVMGYAYAILALVRLAHYPLTSFELRAGSSRPPGAFHAITMASTTPARRKREVVWIIFDELDFNATLGVIAPRSPPVPALANLSERGVSATQAYSPARDTEMSLPALLSGYPPAGLNLDSSGRFWIRTRTAGVRQFQEADSVFGRLPEGPSGAAILGFFHPYCKLFPSVSPCIAQPYDNVGRWYDGVIDSGDLIIDKAASLPGIQSLVPNRILSEFDFMYRISEEQIDQLPRFLNLQDKSLIFLHINLPHLPAYYAERALNYAAMGDDNESYRRNLRLVDQLIVTTVASLEQHSNTSDILLIISSDHWFRAASPRMVQRIPWIAWHVGEAQHTDLKLPINTVHTADLVVDFLNQRVTNQVDIAKWWAGKSFYPPLMPGKYGY